MPRPADELRKTESPEDAEARRLAGLEKRREHAALKETLRKETVVLKVPDDAKTCPKCGGHVDRVIGAGKRTTTIEYVPGYFVQREHVQETLGCSCGEHIVTAPPVFVPLARPKRSKVAPSAL